MSHPYVLLDRDGTIIAEKHYLSRVEDVELLPGAYEALRKLAEHGCKLIVITNQSGVGRGLITAREVEAIHLEIRRLVPWIEAFYYCPHAPSEKCLCRKPLPELAHRAAADFGFDLKQSFVIGDKASDIEFGNACGATTIQVMTGYGSSQKSSKAAFTAAGLEEAANIIVQSGNAPRHHPMV